MTFFGPSDTRIAHPLTRFSNSRVAGSSPAAPTIPQSSPQDTVIATLRPSETKTLVATLGKEVRDDYLKARVRHLLDQAENEVNSKLRFALLERVRDLSRRLRRHEGISIWLPLGFAAALAIALVALLIAYQPTGYVYSAPDNRFRILEQINEYDFVMQRVELGISQIPSVMHFCHDYKPGFEAGMTLTWLAFDDQGKCQSISPPDRGYSIQRGSDHWPVLAPNCRTDFTNDHVLCDGVPKFD